LVEQWTFNPFVEGSNPSRPTSFQFNKTETIRAVSSVGRAVDF
jgi:hypothetical protein